MGACATKPKAEEGNAPLPQTEAEAAEVAEKNDKEIVLEAAKEAEPSAAAGEETEASRQSLGVLMIEEETKEVEVAAVVEKPIEAVEEKAGPTEAHPVAEAKAEVKEEEKKKEEALPVSTGAQGGCTIA